MPEQAAAHVHALEQREQLLGERFIRSVANPVQKGEALHGQGQPGQEGVEALGSEGAVVDTESGPESKHVIEIGSLAVEREFPVVAEAVDESCKGQRGEGFFGGGDPFLEGVDLHSLDSRSAGLCALDGPHQTLDPSGQLGQPLKIVVVGFDTIFVHHL